MVQLVLFSPKLLSFSHFYVILPDIRSFELSLRIKAKYLGCFKDRNNSTNKQTNKQEFHLRQAAAETYKTEQMS